MNKDYTHMIVLLDGSGSMAGCWSDTIGSLEKMFNDQKAVDGKLTMSLVIFDTRYSRVYNFMDVKEIKTLKETKSLGGGTALYDSFCRVVDEEGYSLSKIKEKDRPSKVLFCVFTDGYENASKEFNLQKAKEKLAHQRDKYSWDFMFLGADFDVTETATSFGLAPSFAVNYAKNDTANSYGLVNNLVSSYRAGGSRLAAKDVENLQVEISNG